MSCEGSEAGVATGVVMPLPREGRENLWVALQVSCSLSYPGECQIPPERSVSCIQSFVLFFFMHALLLMLTDSWAVAVQLHGWTG